MKVMCVKSPLGWAIAAQIVGSGFPKVMDILPVKVKYKSFCCNGSHEVYDFEEYPLLKGFDARCFAILPEEDADEMNAAEHEAIVPAPMIVESDPLSLEEKALQAYMQVYNLTGDENRAAAVYYKTLNVPMP